MGTESAGHSWVGGGGQYTSNQPKGLLLPQEMTKMGGGVQKQQQQNSFGDPAPPSKILATGLWISVNAKNALIDGCEDQALGILIQDSRFFQDSRNLLIWIQVQRQWHSLWGLPWQRKKMPKIGKREGENQEKEGKIWKKRKNQEGSFTLPLLTDGTGYTTVQRQAKHGQFPYHCGSC